MSKLKKRVNKMSKFQVLYNKINPAKQLKKAYKKGELNEFLTKYYNPNLIKILEKENIVIKIDDYENFNYLLLEHQEFVDYLLKHHIENIKFIPEEFLKEEHLKQYADYLKNNQIDFYDIPRINKILKNDEIINILLNKIHNSDELSFFFNFINDDNYLLQAINIG